MTDKNGIEFKTGDIVEITGAYFKNDNGFYLVDYSPGDPSWCGRSHCLKKISKRGKISTAKYSICFWPISVSINDRYKAAEANRWNAEHAQIEVKSVSDMSEIIAHFQQKVEGTKEYLRRIIWNLGEDSKAVQKERKLIAHYESVIARISV